MYLKSTLHSLMAQHLLEIGKLCIHLLHMYSKNSISLNSEWKIHTFSFMLSLFSFIHFYLENNLWALLLILDICILFWIAAIQIELPDNNKNTLIYNSLVFSSQLIHRLNVVLTIPELRVWIWTYVLNYYYLSFLIFPVSVILNTHSFLRYNLGNKWAIVFKMGLRPHHLAWTVIRRSPLGLIKSESMFWRQKVYTYQPMSRNFHHKEKWKMFMGIRNGVSIVKAFFE